MTARHLVTAAALLGWVVAAYAAAGWQSKPYNTWTDAELKEVLTDSPWASKGSVSYVKTNGASSQAIEDVALVSWVSSLPLRQAGVRQQMTAGQPIPKEIETALATVPPMKPRPAPLLAVVAGPRRPQVRSRRTRCPSR